ncbi:MAG: NAD(P)H-binding protein [Polyangiales bacterium]
MDRLTVVISGARGFVGSRLAEELSPRAHVIGLTRGTASRKPDDAVAAWRQCDLFSYEDAHAALEGADVAVYLVHAMMPSARLTQARFEDLDLISADNFARAARARGVKQIVYLGGLIPDGAGLSKHLESRREVERVLGAHGVPVTALRAGLVVGAGGSSLEMMIRLVERLPVMVCPRWMRMRTQPIDLEDVVKLLAYCTGRAETLGRTYDIGGPDVMTYQQMVESTARALGKRRPMLPVSLFSTGLSCLWVSVVTGAPRALVRPLIDSLNHETIAHARTLQDDAGIPGRCFDARLRAALAARTAAAPRAFRGVSGPGHSDARSVQRLPLPLGYDAEQVAHLYAVWLVRFLPILRTRKEGEHRVSFYAPPLARALLTLAYSPSSSSPDRAIMYVVGGMLARPYDRGRLEFVRVPERREVLAALHDFHPRLPWWIYVLSQARVHEWVMHAYGRYLARVPGEAPSPQRAPDL